MGLELTDLGSSESGPALEAFWHDDGTGFDFIAHHAGTLPFAVVERFVAVRKNLLPTDESIERHNGRPLFGGSGRRRPAE